MDNAPKRSSIVRRLLAYAVTFAAFYLLGTMDGMRVWVQFGVFFVGLIASSILSLMLFVFIATFVPQKEGRLFPALVFISEIIAAVVILNFVIPIIPIMPSP